MADLEMKGSACRIRECAFEMLSMGNDLIDDDDDDDSWDLMGHDLCLKSTFLFCDFSRMISCAPHEDQKKALTDLANKMFYCIHELHDAVKDRSVALTQTRFNETALVLQEVMAFMS